MSDHTSQQAYSALQKLAREQGRTSQQLFELYIHERFLARIAASPLAPRFVLKGGMLLAVLDVRRPTRDADLLARGLANEPEAIRAAVEEIAAVPMNDGVIFKPATMIIDRIREDADYPGDPIVPRRIDYPTLLDDASFQLLGYPLESAIAEKAITMLTLGDANTRDRDYADIYLLSRVHPIEGPALRAALSTVAEHRRAEMGQLGTLLNTLSESRQRPWTAFRSRVGLDALPERFADVVDAVVAFVDGVQAGGARRWIPAEERWTSTR